MATIPIIIHKREEKNSKIIGLRTKLYNVNGPHVSYLNFTCDNNVNVDECIKKEKSLFAQKKDSLFMQCNECLSSRTCDINKLEADCNQFVTDYAPVNKHTSYKF